jgi:hypothetical protein
MGNEIKFGSNIPQILGAHRNIFTKRISEMRTKGYGSTVEDG